MNKLAIGREGYDFKFQDGQFSSEVNIYSDPHWGRNTMKHNGNCDGKVNRETTVGSQVRAGLTFPKEVSHTWTQRV